MRIILTANYSPWSAYSGGGQRSTHNLAKKFSERGHRVTVVYTKSPLEKIPVPGDLPYDIQWASLLNIRSRRDDFFRFFSSFSVAGILKKLLKNETHAIIHSNGEEGGHIGSLFGYRTFGFIATTRYSAYPERLGPYDKLSVTDRFHLLLHENKYLLQAKAIKAAHFCSPPSQWAADKVQKILDINPAKMKPVPNGVPSEFLNYVRQKKANEGPIVFFGRFAYDKGADTLIEALSNIDQKILPDIYLIGRGDLEQDLKKMAANSGISEKITFKPWMSHEEIASELSNARMAVLPSRDENFSLAILSSLCTGCPTISTSVGGTPEIITNEKTGLLVPPSQPEKLKEAILFFLKKPDTREKIGKNGAEYVRNHLTWDESCKKFEHLYEQALARST